MSARLSTTLYIKRNRFFRLKLLSLKPTEVEKLIDGYENEVRDIKKSALQMSWYLRGGASYIDILNMSNQERKLLNEIIENNLETTKKTQLPFF